VEGTHRWEVKRRVMRVRMDTGRGYTCGFVPAGVHEYGYGSRFQTRAQPAYPTRVPAGFWTFIIWPLVCDTSCFKFNSILMLHIVLHTSSKLEYFRINNVSKTANSTVETKVCTQFNLHQECTAEKKPEYMRSSSSLHLPYCI
jgi:hypothetical protein